MAKRYRKCGKIIPTTYNKKKIFVPILQKHCNAINFKTINYLPTNHLISIKIIIKKIEEK